MSSQIAIYPTALKVEQLLKELSRERCQFGHRIMTLPQLVDALWRESGRCPVLLPEIAERMVLEEAMAAAPPDLEERFEVGPGLIDCILGVIRELKSAALEPGNIREAASNLEARAARRVRSIAAIFDGYQAGLARLGVADRHDRARIVLEFILELERAGRKPRFLDGVERLIVAEIYDFNLLQFMIVAALIRMVGDAIVTLQAEPHQVDVTRFPELTWNRFVSEESIADKVLPDFVRRGGRSGQLGFVLEHLFTETDEAPPSFDATVRVIDAPSRYREIEEVAREIRRAMERPGADRIAPERIAVLARDPAPYREYLETIFRSYRIPLRSRGGRALSESPMARLALDILRIPSQGYRRESLERLLASPMPAIGNRSSGDLLRQVGYLDRATRPLADAINQRRRDLERELESLACDRAENAAAVRIALEAARKRLEAAAPLLLDLLAQLEGLEAPGTIADHVDRLRQLMRRFGLEPDDLSSREARMAHAGLASALAELAGSAELVALDRSFTAEEFAGLLESALTDAPLEDDGRDRGQSAGVRALPVLDARGLDFDLVFIIGLHDGGFPLYRGEDPIIPDEVRNALNRPLAAALRRRLGANAPSAPGKVIRTRADRNSEDWFLFFLALSSAEHEVVLTSPAADEGGKPLTRSPFVAEVAALLEPASAGILRRAQSDTLVPALADCFSRREFVARSVADGSLSAGPAPLLGERSALEWIVARAEIEKRRELYLAIPAREQTENGEADARKLALAGPYDGRTGGAEGLPATLFGTEADRPHWSASRLNQLVACGFKFFAAHLLGLREEDEPDYESTALETGTLTHRVLRDLLKSDIDFSERETALRRARGILGELYERERLSARDAAFFRLAWNGIERIVEELIEFECEQAPGPGRDRLILEHPLSFAIRNLPGTEPIELTLTGQLDRLELYRDAQRRIARIRVLDYKTSRNAGKYADLANPEKEFARTDFQLALYLMGVFDRYRAELAPGAEIETGYLVLKHWDKLQACRISPELIEIDPQRRAEVLARDEFQPVADRIIGLAMEAAAGHFDVDPLRCDDWCPFRRVCRYQKPGR